MRKYRPRKPLFQGLARMKMEESKQGASRATLLAWNCGRKPVYPILPALEGQYAPRALTGALSWLVLTAILVLSHFCPPAWADQRPSPIKLDRQTGHYSLAGHLELYEDKTGHEAFDSIRSKEFRSTPKAVPNIGETQSAYWIKFALDNDTDALLTVILAVSNVHLDFVDIFVTSNRGAQVARYRGGTRAPWEERVSQGGHPVLALDFAPHEHKTVFVRVQSQTPLWIPLAISSEEAYHKDELGRNLFLGVFYGVMGFLIVWNLFAWTILKQRSYLYYILTLVGVVTWQLGYDGLSPHVTIFSRPEKMLHLFQSMPSLVFVFNIIFVSSFLNARNKYPFLYRIFDVFLILAVGVLLLYATNYYIGNYAAKFYGIALSWMFVIVIGLMWYRGETTARYLFLAHVSFPILGAIVISQLQGFLPYNVFWLNALKIGYLLQGMFLSLALADQYATMQGGFRHMLEDQVAERSAELTAANESLQHEVIERTRIERLIAKAKREWEQTFDTVPDLIAIIDRDFRIQRLNKAMAAKLGVHPRDAIGLNCHEVCHGTDHPIDICPLHMSLADGKEHSAEVFEPRLSGTFLVSVTPLQVNGSNRPEMFVHVARDITERKIFEEKLRKLAITDSLTEIWNRRQFMQLAQRELDRTKRYGGHLAILMMDLDRFKAINDAYGHDVGDEALKKVAEIGRTSLRQVDIFARYGGEEFVAALPQTDLEQAVQVAERLRHEVAETLLTADSRPVHITLSIGVTVAGPELGNLATLLKNADQALYKAKNNGRNRVEVFEPDGSTLVGGGSGAGV
ncbi:MAG: diguanylate cyclase [Thermodesulfobacteriota bacterium]